MFPVLLLFNLVTLVLSQNHSILSDTYGCDGIRGSLAREPIPGTHLVTGTFYVVRLNGRQVSGYASGYMTWTGKQHEESRHRYVYVDSHYNMSNYQEGGAWYGDCQWAFLKTPTPGWYHLINCGNTAYLATWSNWKESYGNGRYPLILDMNYPGNHSRDDYLFKPVQVENGLFYLLVKGFNGGVVSESDRQYLTGSNHMQVENHTRTIERQDFHGLMIFEEVNDAHLSGWFSDESIESTSSCFIKGTISFLVGSILVAIVCLVVYKRKQPFVY